MHKRITITIDEEVLRLAEGRVAAGEARSLSALIAGATEQHVRREKASDIAAGILAEIGPPTPEERAWVDEIWGASRSMRARSSGSNSA